MSNLFDLKGKVAIVTGASSGLGAQMAKALARQGADVAILARRVEKLNQVKAEIDKLGVRCLAIQCDVLVNSDITKAVAAIKEHFGKIDILVNNAGVGMAAPAEEMTDEMWRKVIDTNLNSYFFFSREVSKIMIENHYGKIINIGSIHSTVAMSGLPVNAYAASKGGVLMLTKALAVEWAKYNITVNAIGPAYFGSEMTAELIDNPGFAQVLKTYCPMGRAGKEGELDGAVVYLASDASSFTTGQILNVDGGWTAI